MEGNVLDIFRVLSLVVVWAIPAILVLAVVVFIFAAPAATLLGAVLRLYEGVRNKLRKKGPAEIQLPAEAPKVGEIATAYGDMTREAAQAQTANVAQKQTAKKELVRK